MSAPDAAAFIAHTAELDRLVTDITAAERALTGSLQMLAEAEARLRQILTDDGNCVAALAELEQAAAGVNHAEGELAAALATAMAAIGTGRVLYP